MAKKQNIKTMADRILSGNRFNIPPLTEMEKKELKERTLLTILVVFPKVCLERIHSSL